MAKRPGHCSSWPPILFLLFDLVQFGLLMTAALILRFSQNTYRADCDYGIDNTSMACSVLYPTYYKYRPAFGPMSFNNSSSYFGSYYSDSCEYSKAAKVDPSTGYCYYDFWVGSGSIGLNDRVTCNCPNKMFMGSFSVSGAIIALGVMAASFHLLISLLLIIYAGICCCGCCRGKPGGKGLIGTCMFFLCVGIVFQAAQLGVSMIMANEFQAYNNVPIKSEAGFNMNIATLVMDIIFFILMIIYQCLGGRHKIYCCTQTKKETATTIVIAPAAAPAPQNTSTTTTTTEYVAQPQPMVQQIMTGGGGYMPPQGYYPQGSMTMPQQGSMTMPQPGYYSPPPPQVYTPGQPVYVQQ